MEKPELFSFCSMLHPSGQMLYCAEGDHFRIFHFEVSYTHFFIFIYLRKCTGAVQRPKYFISD
uniref:Uncharacterized protein n=1 Tax=Anguilla anguilla TaxID=7936 RepID=A0A0E9W891_ANGAN